jgi:hypothetical protein
VLLAALGDELIVDLSDWAFLSYRLAAIRLLERAKMARDAASIDSVMQELILPRELARTIRPADLESANPYVDPGWLLHLYVLQRGGSGVFRAVR